MIEGALVVVIVQERLIEKEEVLLGYALWVEAKGFAEGAQVLKAHEFTLLHIRIDLEVRLNDISQHLKQLLAALILCECL